MDIEEKLMVGLREALAELALNGTVAGTDVVVQDLAEDLPHVFDFGQLGRVPVVQELSALLNDVSKHASVAWIGSIVEGVGVQPETVYGATKAITLGSGEETSVLEIELPLFRGIDIFPFLCYAADSDYLFEESERGRNVAEEVCWLTGVVRYELNGVLEGPVVGFGGLEQNGQLRRGSKDPMKTATG